MDLTKTIIPLTLMASESIAHLAFSLMDYWLRAHSGSRNNCLLSLPNLTISLIKLNTTYNKDTREKENKETFQPTHQKKNGVSIFISVLQWHKMDITLYLAIKK